MLHKLKYLIALCFITLMAYGQSTSGWSIVTTDGTDLYQDGAVIAEEITNVVARSQGSVRIRANAYEFAYTNVVTAGTDVGGYTNTFEADQIYDAVQETGVFTNKYFFYSAGVLAPYRMSVIGYYDGNPAHYISVLASNKVTGVFDEVGQMQDAASDDAYEFNFLEPSTNYSENGTSTVAFVHIGGAVSSHYLYLDLVRLDYFAQLLTNAGTYYDLYGGTVLGAHAMTVTNLPVSFAIELDGDYHLTMGGSGAGTSNTIYTMCFFTNDVESSICFDASIGPNELPESSWMEGDMYLTNGTVVKPKIKANRSEAYATPLNFYYQVERTGK